MLSLHFCLTGTTWTCGASGARREYDRIEALLAYLVFASGGCCWEARAHGLGGACPITAPESWWQGFLPLCQAITSKPPVQCENFSSHISGKIEIIPRLAPPLPLLAS